MQDLIITFIQSQLHWENVEANLEMFTEKIRSIPKQTDLLILPEMFSTGFTMNSKLLAETMKGRTVNWLRQMAKEMNCVVMGSVIIKEKNTYFNRLIWMMPNGKYEIYDKRHLFRYAGEEKYYSPGKKKLIVELNGWRICPLICYDLRFPVWARNKITKSKSDYDLLIFIANWPERRRYPWKTLLMARAIENQCYVVGVNRVGIDGNNIDHSGDSAAIDFKGEMISKMEPHVESTESISLSKRGLDEWRNHFPAWMDADKFKIL